jgi:phosphoglycolate phosphatase
LNSLSIRGVVFDLDATLVNLGEHVRWREAQGQIIEAYRECGCSDSDLAQCSSKGLFNLMHEMDMRLSAWRSPVEMSVVREGIWSILDKYEREGVERCSFMPGTYESLTWLRKNCVKMGVCTSNSGSVAEKVLDKLGVSSYFDSVIGRTIGLRMKPHPDQVLACFEGIEVNPRDGVMVGDSHNDVLAAKAAGARAIAIPVYFTRKEALEAAKPDAVVTSMIELPKVLLTLK